MFIRSFAVALILALTCPTHLFAQESAATLRDAAIVAWKAAQSPELQSEDRIEERRARLLEVEAAVTALVSEHPDSSDAISLALGEQIDTLSLDALEAAIAELPEVVVNEEPSLTAVQIATAEANCDPSVDAHCAARIAHLLLPQARIGYAHYVADLYGHLGDFEAAYEVLAEHGEADRISYFLHRLAEHAWDTGNRREIFRILGLVEEEWTRIGVLLILSAVCTEEDCPADGNAYLDRALEIAETSENADQGRRQVVEFAARFGDLERSVEVSARIEDHYLRLITRQAIISWQGARGDVAGVIARLEGADDPSQYARSAVNGILLANELDVAIETWTRFGDHRDHQPPLWIARHAYEAGRLAEAETHLSQSIETAATSDRPVSRLVGIVEDLARAEWEVPISGILSRAEAELTSLAKDTENPWHIQEGSFPPHEEMTWHLAKALAEHGEIEAIRRVMANVNSLRALDSTGAIAIISAFDTAGHLDWSKTLIEDIRSSSGIPNGFGLDVLRRRSEQMLQAGDIEGALSLASELSESESQLWLTFEMAETIAEIDMVLAVQIVEEALTQFSADAAYPPSTAMLRYMSKFHAEAGNFTRAAELLNEIDDPSDAIIGLTRAGFELSGYESRVTP